MPRLDRLLVSLGHFATRSRARDAILRGAVSVDGVPAAKPGQEVAGSAAIAVDDPARAYVARSALKLKHALDRFGLSPAGLMALDIGASTGGFTQLLLERGAAHVVAVDVGSGQLAAPLRRDPRVTLIEGLNARDLSPAHLPFAPRFLVADVSFISLRLALPPALALAAPGATLVALVKPQFEAGPAHVDRGGLVREEVVRQAVVRGFRAWLEGEQGWIVLGAAESPLPGGDGNVEYLVAARKS